MRHEKGHGISIASLAQQQHAMEARTVLRVVGEESKKTGPT
jgi:hypothetical protein